MWFKNALRSKKNILKTPNCVELECPDQESTSLSQDASQANTLLRILLTLCHARGDV